MTELENRKSEDIIPIAYQQWDKLHDKQWKQIDDLEDKIDGAKAG